MLNTSKFVFVGACLLLLSTVVSAGQVAPLLVRDPDVSGDRIALVYAGDIWLVPKTGGLAIRLTSPRAEERFPKFSPDGTQIAFSANYDGNRDLYTLRVHGGEPHRVTHHPANDDLMDWCDDGERLLYATTMTSFRSHVPQLYTTSVQGGLPQKVPVSYGVQGALSRDNRWLALTLLPNTFEQAWKRYRGGRSPDIWLYDVDRRAAENVLANPAVDGYPMWHGPHLYFLSERGPNQRANLWDLDTETKQIRQVTSFTEIDVRQPSIGPHEIVFTAGPDLYLLDLESHAHRKVPLSIPDDRLTLRSRQEDVTDRITFTNLSPQGKRLLIQARGDVFTVPAREGATLNLTHSTGIAERYPTWSPDGTSIAYFSDRSGEYQLTLRPADGRREDEEVLTQRQDGFAYQPQWSPDSTKIAFIDNTMTLNIIDVSSKATSQIDRALWMMHGQLQAFRVSWSKDSRWLAYARELENRNQAIFLYDTHAAKRHQVTSGHYNDQAPVFDPEGEFLYYLSMRNFEAVNSDIEPTWAFVNSTQVVAAPLRPSVRSPFLPGNDDESPAADGDGQSDADPKTVIIDLDGLEHRSIVLPLEAGNYLRLAAIPNAVIFHRSPRSGSTGRARPLGLYRLDSQKEEIIVEDASDFVLSARGQKLLIRHQNHYYVTDAAAKQALEKPVSLKSLRTHVNPKQEWLQMLRETWRYQRDFFYDSNLHGLDWDTIYFSYLKLMNAAVTHWDAGFVLREMVGELSAGHVYVSAGPAPEELSGTHLDVGLLGIDFALEQGAYRIQRIQRAHAGAEIRSPLDEPGIDAQEGDFLLAVNGRALNIQKDPWAAFQGLSHETTQITVNTKPSLEGARDVYVKPLSLDEAHRLRELAWVEANRQQVHTVSQGRIGYIYVQNTSTSGLKDLVRQYRSQFEMPGLIIDERFNRGGALGDRLIELLNRPPMNYFAMRNGRSYHLPEIAHHGPRAMLINGWSGSGGDGFPYMFRRAGLGPLIGTATWGGFVGPAQSLPLINGGRISAPPIRVYSPEGHWVVEGIGVQPDIPVAPNPGLMARGGDPQLERAMEEVTTRLQTQPWIDPVSPECPVHEVH